VLLATELKQHLFDAFYHAVALETPDTTVVTADKGYLRVARAKGRVMDLKLIRTTYAAIVGG
jgi:hypothetical protein